MGIRDIGPCRLVGLRLQPTSHGPRRREYRAGDRSDRSVRSYQLPDIQHELGNRGDRHRRHGPSCADLPDLCRLPRAGTLAPAILDRCWHSPSWPPEELPI